MKLLYVYIKESKNGLIINKGFNFSKEFNIEYNGDELRINDRERYVDYPHSIYNISALVGENGSGKSTIIQSIRDCGADDKNVYFVFMKDEIFYCNVDMTIIYHETPFKTQEITEKVLMIYTATNMASSETFDNKLNSKTTFGSKLPFKYVYDCSNLGIENYLRDNNASYSHNINDLLYFVVLRFLANNSSYISDFLGANMLHYVRLDRTKEHRATNLLFTENASADKTINLLCETLNDAYKSFTQNLHMSDMQLQVKYSIVLFYLDSMLDNINNDILKNRISSFHYQQINSNPVPEFNESDSLYVIINKLCKYLFPSRLGVNSININKDYLDNIENLINCLSVDNSSPGQNIIIEFDDTAQDLLHQLLVGGYINLFTIKPIDIVGNEMFMSAGEISLLSLFAKIEYIIEPFHVKNGLTLANKKQYQNSKTMILLLDEPDTYLHPNWSRELIHYLIEYLNKKFKQYDIQVILSTNNPFMLSDIYAANVFKLEKRKIDNNITVSQPSKETFGSNVHELLNDTFFMNRTTGEYSYEQIIFIIKQISPLPDGIYQTNEDIVKSINERFGMRLTSEDTYNYLKNMINSLGEIILREKMLSMLDDCFNSGISELERLELKMKNIENEIHKLKSKGNFI